MNFDSEPIAPSKESLVKMLGFIAKDLGVDVSQASNPVTITRMIREAIAELQRSLLEAYKKPIIDILEGKRP